jgi:signal transduction histidine kinase
VGKYETDLEEVDLNVMLQELKEALVTKPGLTMKVQPNLPVLQTYRVPLLQVFSNLISNAVKYHDKQNGFIKIYFKDEIEQYRFFVEDNGPGIAKNYHNKIFVIFQTLNGSDSFQSTGVGLAIVKKILDDMHQEIRLSSDAGKGAIFSFTWPKQV